MKLFILLFLLITGCKEMWTSTTNLNQIETVLRDSLIFADQIEGTHFDDQLIERPKGVPLFLMGYQFSSSDNDELRHCWYYRIPYKLLRGELSFTEQKASEPCAELPPSHVSLKLIDVSSLKLKIENYHLYFQFIYLKQNITWNFSLPNWQRGHIHEKYQPEKIKKLFPAMSLLNIKNELSTQLSDKFLGKMTDRFSSKTAIECLHIDKNCQRIGEDRCDRCRFGWYQVVNLHCSQFGSRFCGQNHCGEKNEPACPRGSKVVEEAEWGICQSDLTPVWNSDQILLCQ